MRLGRNTDWRKKELKSLRSACPPSKNAILPENRNIGRPLNKLRKKLNLIQRDLLKSYKNMMKVPYF